MSNKYPHYHTFVWEYGCKKMKILESSEKILTIFGLCTHKHQNRLAVLQSNCLLLIVFTVVTYFQYSIVKFIVDHVKSYVELNRPFYQIIACVTIYFSLITIFLQRNKVRKIIDDLQAIVNNKSEC